jgi:hypothetical protein
MEFTLLKETLKELTKENHQKSFGTPGPLTDSFQKLSIKPQSLGGELTKRAYLQMHFNLNLAQNAQFT